MAHYAFLDDNNIVIEVIVGKDENELLDGKAPEDWYSEFRGQRCLRTSYNGRIRKNFAGVGFAYNPELDAFIAPKPYESWVLNTESAQWEAPKPYPQDGKVYHWEESELDWKELEI